MSHCRSAPHGSEKIVNGARLFAWLIEHRREARLGPFFLRAVLGHSRGTLPAELERHFEVDLDALEAALLERQASG